LQPPFGRLSGMGGVHALLAIVLAGTCAGCASVRSPEHADDRPTIDISLGTFNILNEGSPLRYGAEYRWRRGRWSIAPGLGFIVADDDARFVYGDLHRDFPLGSDWVTTLSFGGGFFHDGRSVHLGDRTMFQSGVEIGRWINDAWRAGLGFYHLSNGGLSEENPGTEVLVLLISIPVGSTRNQSTAPDSADANCCSSSRRISSPANAR
jgi:hypothetical protein